MKHIVSFSGGVGSFVAATRVVEKYGKENTLLVFTDTLIEDPDLYRFLREGAETLDVELVWLKDGRNPWDVFRDERYIGNSRVAPCSKILKKDQFKKYVDKEFGPNNCVIYLGIDWTEEHRLHRAKKVLSSYKLMAPLCEAPYLSKKNMFSIVDSYGIKLPKLYEMGFSHNNCGGFCVRAGQGQFKMLLDKLPNRYMWHERQMEKVMQDNPKAKPFLRMTKNGKMDYIPLRDFRGMVQDKTQVDMFDIGGCGCFVDD